MTSTHTTLYWSVTTFTSSVRLDNALTAAAITILFYDYFLTISNEIDHFWKRARPSFPSALFVLHRYLGLFGHISVVFEYFGYLSSQRCRQFQDYHQYYIIASQVVVGLILIARTYALYSRSKGLLLGLATLGVLLITVAVVVVSVKSDTAHPAPRYSLVGCGLSLTSAEGLSSAIGWIMMLCMDTTIFVLTLAKAIQMRHSMREGLMAVLLRDGTMYYAVLVIANGTNILTSLLPQIPVYNLGIATTLTNAVSLTLISRICLNLRNPESLSSGRVVGEWSLSGITTTEDSGIPSFQRTTRTDESEDIVLTYRGSAVP